MMAPIFKTCLFAAAVAGLCSPPPPPPPRPPLPATISTSTEATSPPSNSDISGPGISSSGSSVSGSSSPTDICTSGSPCAGDGTYYDTATAMSAPSYCDTANDGTTENVLALSRDIMMKELCGKTVTASYGGKTVTGTVVDKCMRWAKTSIDMSRHMFCELDNLDTGRVKVNWWFH